MSTTQKEDILSLLDRLQVTYRWVDHEAVFTVADSSKVLADKVPIKNLFLTDDKGDQLLLVIMAGERRLDIKQLATDLGIKKLSFAKPDVLQEKLGVSPGSVSVFSLLNNQHNDVQVVVDESLTSASEIGFHPNHNRASIFIAGLSLESILEQTGNTYRFINFS